MSDGVYTLFGVHELPETETDTYNSSLHPRSLGALLSLVGMMLWMTLVGSTRRLKNQVRSD